MEESKWLWGFLRSNVKSSVLAKYSPGSSWSSPLAFVCTSERSSAWDPASARSPWATTASCGYTRAQTLGSLPWLSGCGQSTFWLKGGGGKFIHSRCKPCPAVPWCNLQISFSWLYSLSPWFHTGWPLKLMTWLCPVCILALCIDRKTT